MQDNIDIIEQHVLSSQIEKAEQNQVNNLFRTFFVVMNRHCHIIIDGESSCNIASSELVEKLGLPTHPHPCSYYIQSVNSYDIIKVNKIAHIEFFIGVYSKKG